jgi:hypothetical protein
MAITAPPNCAVRNRDENRAQNTWRTPESGVSLSQFYWRTRTIHQNAGVSRRKLTKLIHRRPPKRGDGFCRRFAFSPSLDRTADGSGAALERLEIGTNRNANSWFLK